MDPTSSLTLAGALLALAVFGKGFRRLRRRGRQYVGWSQATLYVAGLAVGVLAVSPPVDSFADQLLSAHMLQHLLLGDVMTLLLVLGVRGPMSVFFLPASVLRRLGRLGPPRRLLATAFRPLVSLLAWTVVIAAWHVPAAYDFALEHDSVHILQHLSFVVVGLQVWTQIIAPSRHQRLSAGRRAVFAVAVLAAGMVLSELLLVTGPLYPHYRDVLDRPFGLSAAEDQSRAALLMMAEQILTLGTAAALLVWTHVESVSPQFATPEPR
jgi:cytochrome c oxidase assembly factor CtaG